MKARIYKPARTAMQEGNANTKRWLLEFEQEKPRFKSSVMGWIGSSDMWQEISLRFHNQSEAVAFATKNNIDYVVLEPHLRKIVPKSYADNFKY